MPDSLDNRIPVSVAKAEAHETIKQVATNVKNNKNFVEDNIVEWLLEEDIKNRDEVEKTKLEFSKNNLIPKF